MGSSISLGDYYCSPVSFAQGPFGKISAGWTQEGVAVATKRFKDPKEPDIKLHRRLMSHIGNHVQYLTYLSSNSPTDPVLEQYTATLILQQPF